MYFICMETLLNDIDLQLIHFTPLCINIKLQAYKKVLDYQLTCVR